MNRLIFAKFHLPIPKSDSSFFSIFHDPEYMKLHKNQMKAIQNKKQQITPHCWYLEPRNREKSLFSFDNVFHVYLMNALQKYQKKIFFHGGFLR